MSGDAVAVGLWIFISGLTGYILGVIVGVDATGRDAERYAMARRFADNPDEFERNLDELIRRESQS